MTQSNRFVRLLGNIANAALSGLEKIFDPQVSQHTQTPRLDPSAAEKTAALKALFESDAFKNALPSAQRIMIEGVNNVYRK